MVFEVSVLFLRKYALWVISLHGLFTDVFIKPIFRKIHHPHDPYWSRERPRYAFRRKAALQLGSPALPLFTVLNLSHISLNSKWRLEVLQKGHHEGKSRKTWWQQHNTHLQPRDVFTQMCRKPCRWLAGNRWSHLLSYLNERGGLHGFKKGCLWRIFK